MDIKILIIDDDAYTREAMMFFLTEKGFNKISTASDGKEGIQKVKEEKPDIVVLDVILQDEKGYDVCREIKSSITPAPKIILITSQFDHNEPFAASAAQPDYFLAKTSNYESLVKTVRQIAVGLKNK